jgi:hypothetical protein
LLDENKRLRDDQYSNQNPTGWSKIVDTGRGEKEKSPAVDGTTSGDSPKEPHQRDCFHSGVHFPPDGFSGRGEESFSGPGASAGGETEAQRFNTEEIRELRAQNERLREVVEDALWFLGEDKHLAEDTPLDESEVVDRARAALEEIK